MKKIIVLLCIIICISVAVTSVVAAEIVSRGVVGESVINSSIPNYYLDFTDSEVQDSLDYSNQLNIEYYDGYTRLTSTGTDPYFYIAPPEGELLNNRYIVIVYRTSSAAGGEFYASKNDGSPMSQANSNHVDWPSYNATGDWETIVVDLYWMCQSGTEYVKFRYDPFTGVEAGAVIDIKCIAGFSTSKNANGFNFEEYYNYLHADPIWEQPEFVEQQVSADDNYEGTLQYIDNGDGTVTISYMYKGEIKTYTVPNDPIYTSGGFAATDDVGRELYDSNTVGVIGDNGEHYVGLFYFLWMGEHGDPGVYDLTKIQHLYGKDAANANYIDPTTGQRIYGYVGQFHWMGEPLYGYYYSSDEWVMRKHVELLTNAGVDFLYIDVTNGYPYLNNVKKLMGILHEYNEMGYNAPKIVFYTKTNAQNTVTQLYNNIYLAEVYPDTWLYVNGKPCIITVSNDITNLDIRRFFTIKESQWPDAPAQDDAWPWMDFSWPQRVFNDFEGNRSAISVSVAQHCGSLAFSDSAYYFDIDTEVNRGRGYRSGLELWLYRAEYETDPSITNYGYNFQAQWDYAIEQDVPYVLVTGWNEWIAQRQDGAIHRGDANKVMFVDTASQEFSRDIEMMRGGYFDNYYMQLVYNIQKLKGTAPIIIQDTRNPINITGGFDQWDNVLVEYTDPSGDTANRNNLGYGSTYYRDKSGRNDIVSAKVTNDTKNAYFYVSTAKAIQKYDGESSWMQLYINADQKAETGWYGYDYIVNYSAKSDLVTSVAKYNGSDNSYSFVEIGDVSYTVLGNEMMISVPLEMLGICNYNEICVEFKWFDADAGVLVDEMEDFYTYGDAAPLGRLNYTYQNCLAEDVTNTPIDNGNNNGNNDNNNNENDNDGNDDVVEDATTAPSDILPMRGCGSSVGCIAIIPVIICGAFAVKKKKRNQ